MSLQTDIGVTFIARVSLDSPGEISISEARKIAQRVLYGLFVEFNTTVFLRETDYGVDSVDSYSYDEDDPPETSATIWFECECPSVSKPAGIYYDRSEYNELRSNLQQAGWSDDYPELTDIHLTYRD